MWINVIFVVLGLIVIVASMALILNPPEAWVKRAFLRDRREKKD